MLLGIILFLVALIAYMSSWRKITYIGQLQRKAAQQRDTIFHFDPNTITYEQLRELRLLYNGNATDCIIPTMYEAALLFAGRAQIHFDCKVADKLDVDSDIFLLAEATGSKESFIYYYGLNTMVKWQSLNKSDEDFKQFVVKMNKYLKMSGHGLRRRNFDMIAKHGDTVEGWKKAWDEGYKMTFTNKIYDFSKYIAENCEPIKLP